MRGRKAKAIKRKIKISITELPESLRKIYPLEVYQRKIYRKVKQMYKNNVIRGVFDTYKKREV